MYNRFAFKFVAGAAILSLVAAAASAQDTTRVRTRSSRRIPIAKESRGEVVSRVDTVTVYRTDTLNLPGRVDTVATTITRVDTVQVGMPIAPIRHIGGVYFGLAGGASFPAADQNNVNKPGPRVDAMLGFDPIDFPLGLRLDGGYSTHNLHDNWSSQNLVPGSAKFWDVSGDIKLRAPALAPFGFHFQMYGLAGGTFNYWKNLIQVAPNGQAWAGRTPLTSAGGGIYTYNGTTTSSWYHNWGWNVGGGAQLGWKRVNLFAETRFQRFHDQVNVANVPVVMGISWY